MPDDVTTDDEHERDPIGAEAWESAFENAGISPGGRRTKSHKRRSRPT